MVELTKENAVQSLVKVGFSIDGLVNLTQYITAFNDVVPVIVGSRKTVQKLKKIAIDSFGRTMMRTKRGSDIKNFLGFDVMIDKKLGTNTKDGQLYVVSLNESGIMGKFGVMEIYTN